MAPRTWWLLTLGVVVAIVAATCWPPLGHPQLEPDDYRYLRLADDVLAGRVPLTDAFVVENRWDALWFPAADEVVRFFRPTVVTSFLVDRLVSGTDGGLLLTNVALHLAAALLVAVLALRLLGAGLPALLAAALFAAFAAHAEVIWFVSGRTGTLTAIGFLAALLLHGAGPRLRWAALPFFALAFASKELAVGLPVVCLLHDRWVARRGTLRELLRRDWRLYAGYAAVALGLWALRSAALGGVGGAPLEPPYFVSPLSAAFPAHLGAQLWSYGENLLLGGMTAPFLEPAELAGSASVAGLLAVLVAIGAAIWLLRREPAFRLAAALAAVTWLPTSFVYVSERYLYLPSVAVALTAGLALQRCSDRRVLRRCLAALVAVWVVHQALVLCYKQRWVSHAPRAAWAVAALVREQAARLPRGGKLLFLNLPSDVVHAQFLEDQLRVVLGDPALVCRVLTLAQPGTDGELTVRRLDARTLELRAAGALMLPDRVFPMVPMRPDTVVRRPRSGCEEVTVLDGDGTTLRAARFRLDAPLADWTVLRWQPPPAAPAGALPGARILAGRLLVVRP